MGFLLSFFISSISENTRSLSSSLRFKAFSFFFPENNDHSMTTYPPPPIIFQISHRWFCISGTDKLFGLISSTTKSCTTPLTKALFYVQLVKPYIFDDFGHINHIIFMDHRVEQFKPPCFFCGSFDCPKVLKRWFKSKLQS